MLFLRSLFILSLAVLFLACSSSTDTTAQTTPTESSGSTPEVANRISEWEVAANPEGVAIGRGVIYATHFGEELKPMDQDGDGYIAVYDANGKFLRNLVTGLDAPKGIEVLGNQLFVADIDSLIGFSVKDGERLFTASFTGKAKFLNGLAAADEGNLYISATDAGKIWKVNIVSGEITFIADVPAVNGIAVSSDGSVIYAVQYNSQDPAAGRLLAVNPFDGSLIPLGTYSGMLDGVYEYNGAVYFTDWNPSGVGKVLRYDLQSNETTVILEDDRLQGPADFEVLGDGRALIPMLTGSSIIGVKLK